MILYRDFAIKESYCVRAPACARALNQSEVQQLNSYMQKISATPDSVWIKALHEDPAAVNKHVSGPGWCLDVVRSLIKSCFDVQRDIFGFMPHPESVLTFPQLLPLELNRLDQSKMFPSSFRYDMLRHGAGVPLRPRPIVHGHPRVAALMGCQHHVTGGHSWAAQDARRSAEVHASPGEQSLELLLGQEVTRFRQEGMEGHADGAGDVSWFCVCRTERESKMHFNQ